MSDFHTVIAHDRQAAWLDAVQRLKPAFDLTILVLTVAIVGSQSLMMSPLIPDLAKGLSVGAGEIGIAIGAYGGATGLSAVLLGPRLDGFARRRVLTLGLLVLAVALALGSQADHWLLFALAQVMGGMAAGVLLPITYAAAADMAPVGRNAAFMGKVLMGWSIAMIAGVPLGGWLGDWFGWRGALQVMAGLALVIAIGTSCLTRHRKGMVAETRKTMGLAQLRAALAVPMVRPLLAICFCIMLAFYAAYGFLGAHARALHGGGSGTVSMLALCYGIGFAITGLVSGVIDRLGTARSSVFSNIVITAVYLAMPVMAALGMMPLAGLMVVFGLLNHMALNAVVSGLSGADPSRRGTILSINTGVTYGGFMVGSALGGALFDSLGYGAVSVLSASALVVAIGVGIRLLPRR